MAAGQACVQAAMFALTYEAAKRARLRAEARLAAFLRDEARHAGLDPSTATRSGPRPVPDFAAQGYATVTDRPELGVDPD